MHMFTFGGLNQVIFFPCILFPPIAAAPVPYFSSRAFPAPDWIPVEPCAWLRTKVFNNAGLWYSVSTATPVVEIIRIASPTR